MDPDVQQTWSEKLWPQPESMLLTFSSQKIPTMAKQTWQKGACVGLV